MNPRRLCPKKTDHRDGFTFVELLVVLTTTALLPGFLLPAMATSKPNSQALQCLNNQRQLALGWNMYCNDNQRVASQCGRR
jgi:competence protein ComGC